MKRIRTLLKVTVLSLLISSSHAKESLRIDIEAGTSSVVVAPLVKRIAVGNGNIVQASAMNGKEVLIFGKSKGMTTLDLWLSNGKRISYQIHVSPEGLKHVYREINLLLQTIPNAHSLMAGDKVLIQGEDLSDSDQAKIANLARLYPDVIDFTSQQGWDRMVLLDVQVLEIPSSRMQELGVRWDPNTSGGMHAGVAWEGASSSLLQRPADAALAVAFPAKQAAGMLGLNALLSARIAALSKSGEAVILAQPQLLARSGSTASFLAGGEVPYASVDKEGKSTTTFKKYGVSLNITPRADRNGAIRSKIEIEVSSVDSTISVPGGPALKIRKASTEFNVRSGQTLVIGGFLSRDKSSDQDGIPGLSELPFLGGLFGVKREQARQTELAIFVTPIVVDAQHPQMLARVSKGNTIIANEFPEKPLILEPIRNREILPDTTQLIGSSSQWESVTDHLSSTDESMSDSVSYQQQWEE